MFKLGEMMMYGTNGVCRVGEICSSPFDKSDPRTFYTLMPLSDNSNLVIYTPVDNDNVIMRYLISREEAEALLRDFASYELITVDIEKKRRDIYREIVQSGEPGNYIRIIRTVKKRREDFRRTRRRLPDLDNDFEHTAKKCLYSELSVVLGMTRDEVHKLICKKLEDFPAE